MAGFKIIACSCIVVLAVVATVDANGTTSAATELNYMIDTSLCSQLKDQYVREEGVPDDEDGCKVLRSMTNLMTEMLGRINVLEAQVQDIIVVDGGLDTKVEALEAQVQDIIVVDGGLDTKVEELEAQVKDIIVVDGGLDKKVEELEALIEMYTNQTNTSCED